MALFATEYVYAAKRAFCQPEGVRDEQIDHYLRGKSTVGLIVVALIASGLQVSRELRPYGR